MTPPPAHARLHPVNTTPQGAPTVKTFRTLEQTLDDMALPPVPEKDVAEAVADLTALVLDPEDLLFGATAVVGTAPSGAPEVALTLLDGTVYVLTVEMG